MSQALVECIRDSDFIGHAYAELLATATSTEETTTDATPRLITAWDENGESNILVPDHANDYITSPVAGVYHVNFSASLIGTAAEEANLEIYIYDLSGTSWGASGIRANQGPMSATVPINLSAVGIVTLDAGDRVGLYQSSPAGIAMTIEEAQLVLVEL